MNGLRIQELLLLILSLGLIDAMSKPPCDYYRSVNITGAVINDYGSALFDGKEYLNGSYGYFNDSFFGSSKDVEKNKNKTHLRGCFCHLPGKPCVAVCCPSGFIKRDEYESTCYPYKYVLFANTSNYENNYTTFNFEDKYRMVQRDPCPKYQQHIYSKWELLENGTLRSDTMDDNDFYEYGDFCIDPILTQGSTIYTKISICYKIRDSSNRHAVVHEYEILGMIFSIVFLSITLLIYFLVPHLQDLRGKLLMCYMTSIVIFYTFVAFDKAEILIESPVICTVVGFISYGSALMAIFFLNAASLDYFTAFYIKDYRAANKPKLFRWYLLYSVGATLILVFVAAILDASDIVPTEYSPKIGIDSCFLHSDRVGKFIFFYFFVAVTVFLNTLLLIVTGCKMRRIMKTRTMGKDDRNNYNDRTERETFCHLLLLFLFVDFSWITEVFFWYVDVHRGGRNSILHGFQFFGYSQGIWIFIICILRGRTFELIGKRWTDFMHTKSDSEGGDIKYLRTDSNISEVHPSV